MKEPMIKKTVSSGTPSMPMSVRIEKAQNGYTVSCYDDEGEKKMIAKDMKQATKMAQEMMNKEEKD